MALLLHVKGTQLDANYAVGNTKSSTCRDQSVADAVLKPLATPGVFGGSVIDVADATRTRAISYVGGSIWTGGPAISVLLVFLSP